MPALRNAELAGQCPEPGFRRLADCHQDPVVVLTDEPLPIRRHQVVLERVALPQHLLRRKDRAFVDQRPLPLGRLRNKVGACLCVRH